VSEVLDPWASTSETVVTLAGRELRILHPSNSDALISEADYVMDERLPYWADLWPSSRVLAGIVVDEPDAGGKTLLELGCGLGLVSLAAKIARFSVLATDYYRAALEFARHNVLANGEGELRTLPLDWRADPPPLREFDYVVASDVLYEQEYGRIVAELMFRFLRMGGTALVADPGRIAADAFLRRCGELGLRLASELMVPITDASRQLKVNVYRMVKTA
jgi:predicted nicotinamide N-methyase